MPSSPEPSSPCIFKEPLQTNVKSYDEGILDTPEMSHLKITEDFEMFLSIFL